MRARPLLAAIVWLGLGLRLRGITFGLPNTLCRPDEAYIINIAMRFGTGDLNPHTFFYPALYFYALFGLYVLYFVVGRLFGRFGSVADFIAEYHLDPTVFYLIDRTLAAVLGTATIVVSYLIVRRLVSERAGLIAGFFTAVAFLHVRDSHFGTTDVPLTFLLALSMYLIVRMREAPTVWRYLAAGIAIGIAGSVKHTGALMLVTGWAAHTITVIDERRWARVVFDKRLWLFAASSGLAFLVANPFTILDWTTFAADLRLQFTELGGSILYYRKDPGWWTHATFSLFYGVGWPILAAFAAGLIVWLAADWRSAAIVASFPIVYYAFFGRGYAVALRYAVPLVPFVCMIAAYGTDRAGSWLFGRLSASRRPVAVGALAVLLAIPSIWSSVRFVQLLATEDTRLAGARWISENVPPGSSIYQASSPYGLMQLDHTREMLQEELRQTEAVGGQGAGPKAKLARAQQAGIVGFDEWIRDDEKGFFSRMGKRTDQLPDYIIVEDSPLIGYRREAERAQPLVEKSYDLAVFIKGVDTSHPENQFDQQDVFYVPYAGFHAERPGPGFRIYKRR